MNFLPGFEVERKLAKLPRLHCCHLNSAAVRPFVSGKLGGERKNAEARSHNDLAPAHGSLQLRLLFQVVNVMTDQHSLPRSWDPSAAVPRHVRWCWLLHLS